MYKFKVFDETAIESLINSCLVDHNFEKTDEIEILFKDFVSILDQDLQSLIRKYKNQIQFYSNEVEIAYDEADYYHSIVRRL